MRRRGGPDRASTRQIALERIWPLIEGTCGCDVDVLRARISALIGRTLAAMAPTVAHAYSNVWPTPRTTGSARAAPGGSSGRLHAPSRRCFQLLGFDVMLDDEGGPWLVEARQRTHARDPRADLGPVSGRSRADLDFSPQVNHSPSMAIDGAAEEEIATKVSVVRAALRLAVADDPSDESLCAACEVTPLADAAPHPAPLERARRLFEAAATSRAGQQWAMPTSVLERLIRPILDAEPPSRAEPAAAAAAHVKLAGALARARKVIAAAASSASDYGTGWDAPPASSLTYFGFVEALVGLAPLTYPELCAGPEMSDAEGTSVGGGGQGIRGPGSGRAFEALVERLAASTEPDDRR